MTEEASPTLSPCRFGVRAGEISGKKDEEGRDGARDLSAHEVDIYGLRTVPLIKDAGRLGLRGIPVRIDPAGIDDIGFISSGAYQPV